MPSVRKSARRNATKTKKSKPRLQAVQRELEDVKAELRRAREAQKQFAHSYHAGNIESDDDEDGSWMFARDSDEDGGHPITLAGNIESDTDTDTDTDAYESCDDGHTDADEHTDTDVRTDDACGSATLVLTHVQTGEDGGYDASSEDEAPPMSPADQEAAITRVIRAEQQRIALEAHKNASGGIVGMAKSLARIAITRRAAERAEQLEEQASEIQDAATRTYPEVKAECKASLLARRKAPRNRGGAQRQPQLHARTGHPRTTHLGKARLCHDRDARRRDPSGLCGRSASRAEGSRQRRLLGGTRRQRIDAPRRGSPARLAPP